MNEGQELTPDSDDAPLALPNYQLVRKIGVGSYGEVWLAKHLHGAWRALKLVPKSKFPDDKRCQRERNGLLHFEPLSRKHDHLVDILDSGENAAYLYYVMELADSAAENSEQAGKTIEVGTYKTKSLQIFIDSGRRIPGTSRN